MSHCRPCDRSDYEIRGVRLDESAMNLSEPNHSVLMSQFLSSQEPRKLSYAEVCQRPPKDPPPAAPAPSSSPSPTTPTPGQPLRELRVNKAEEPGSSGGSGVGGGDKQEKSHDREGGWELKESRPPRDRDSQGYYRSNGPRGAGGLKFRDQRRPPPARRNSPQGNYRHTGKEQNIPPVSPK